MKIRLKNVRIAFPSLARPESMGDGTPAYAAKFIIDPEGEHAEEIQKAINEVATEKWAAKAPKILKMLKDDKKMAYVEGEYRSRKTGDVYAGFEGKHYLSARRAEGRPTILDRFGVEVKETADIERLIYSGCYVHAMIDIWAQDNKYGQRINASLQGVMFATDGDSFGGSSAASADDFADLAAQADDLI